jgi:hypothetical protein
MRLPSLHECEVHRASTTVNCVVHHHYSHDHQSYHQFHSAQWVFPTTDSSFNIFQVDGGHGVLPALSVINNIMTCERTARQRLDKHPGIQARNNGTKDYATLF